jgi:hypothetical protein
MLANIQRTDSVTVPLLARSALALPAGVQPVTFGVPFAKGCLREPFTAVLEGTSIEGIQLQTRPLARWSDDSIKWLLVDGILPALPAGDHTLQIRLERYLPDWTGRPQVRIVQCDKRAVVVDTGKARFHIEADIFRPFRRVSLHGINEDLRLATEVVFTDARGRLRHPRISDIEVETAGPLRTTLFFSGDFGKRRWLRFSARLSFFAGTGLVRASLALHNPRRARHKGGLWDLGDPGSVLFRDFSLGIALPADKQVSVRWKAESESSERPLPPGTELEIYQDSSGGENWQSRNHVNREGRVPCRFRGYRVRMGQNEEYGLRASPLLQAIYGEVHIGAAITEFWQQFPKSIEYREGRIWLRLFPHQWDDLHELQGGERKTHHIWLEFATGERASSLEWVHSPVRICCTPQWYARTGAVPYLLPAVADPDDRLRRLMHEALYGTESLLKKRETVDEYGWRNYGDVWADHEEAYYDGPKPIISHFNNQYDLLHGAIVQLMRTGEVDWYEVITPLGRHVMDIDIYRTMEDKAAYSGGLFWFTDHYRDAATCTHRTYSRKNLPNNGVPYGGGPSNEHLYTTGLLHYYYLTGEEDAKAAVLGLADWAIAMDDGRLSVLGLVDEGPTGLASQTAFADYHGPGRGPGYVINALLDGWELTGRARYREKAEELIQRCIHPADDIAARNLLDAERRWSYTVFLSAIARYLDMKAELGGLDWHYAYAQHALVQYARWMAEHERPYLDRPEELEYPTETWAAQDLRKANVLRYAARHVDPESAQVFLARAEQLSDRAWEDLLRFPTRHYTRPVAIAMREGAWDAWFRSVPEPGRQPIAPMADFGKPVQFVPQKQRVLQLTKTPSGWAAIALRLAHPECVKRLVRIVLSRSQEQGEL